MSRVSAAGPSTRRPIDPPVGMSNTDLSVMVWQMVHVMPTLSPFLISSLPSLFVSFGTTPTTAFALTSATVVAGSLSAGAAAGERSVLSSRSKIVRNAAGTASTST